MLKKGWTAYVFPIFLSLDIKHKIGGEEMDNTLYLVLENGKVFEGYSIGAKGTACGEVVFNTAVLGYNEALTSQIYCGQLLVQTFPLIGNYGVIDEELDSKKPSLAAYIVKFISDSPSNFRTSGKLEEFLKRNNIIGLAGIDTRELTKVLRDEGTMNGKITDDISDLNAILNELKAFKAEIDTSVVSCSEPKTYDDGKNEFNVCMLDLGTSQASIETFTKNGICVTLLPYNTTYEKILSYNPDGVILSDGPGNPNDCSDTVDIAKKLYDNGTPIYGCGLGHEICALALDAKVVKHKFGHRGANQPVKNTKNGKIYITTQNHGYIVDENTLPASANVTFINVNDKTVEGFSAKNMITTQFAPNPCNGPHNTEYIIDEFKSIMNGEK